MQSAVALCLINSLELITGIIMLKRFCSLATACLFALPTCAAQNNKLHVLAIPGQNGLGSSSEYVLKCLGSAVRVTEVITPGLTADLGQGHCMSYLHRACTTNQGLSIVHATSQGTATALNYAAQDQGKQIKALVLEAALASGNSAIHHTASGPIMNLNWLASLPGAYYWMPYVAKIHMPFYSPSGVQAIQSVDAIPTSVPVVIAHSKNDPQLPYAGACALYYRLRQQGKPAYLITKPGHTHVEIMDSTDASVVQKILAHHGLLPRNNAEQVDLRPYQPDHNQFKHLYDDLAAQERNHRYLGYGVKAAVTVVALTLLYKTSGYWLSKLQSLKKALIG
jgi:fermentation-respiration switch protein FrsA (DUF1100 family)